MFLKAAEDNYNNKKRRNVVDTINACKFIESYHEWQTLSEKWRFVWQNYSSSLTTENAVRLEDIDTKYK